MGKDDDEKKKRRRRPWGPWGPFGFFTDFRWIEEMTDRMMKEAFREFEGVSFKGVKRPFGRVRRLGPYVYGFSMTVGPDGKPIVKRFGNLGPSGLGRPELRKEREPLIDVVEEEEEVVVVAELPGVDKEDIDLRLRNRGLTISVDTPSRKYFKELELPTEVEKRGYRATYKNGVLEARFKKAKRETKEERLEIE